MTATEQTPPLKLLAVFQASANAAQSAEAQLRSEFAAKIALSERRRVHAYRRIRLVKSLLDSLGNADQEIEECWSTQRLAVAHDLGWSTVSDNYAAILDQIRPLAMAIRSSVAREFGGDADDVMRQLEIFETWFEQKHGKSFYVLYDQYVPEVPVVDF